MQTLIGIGIVVGVLIIILLIRSLVNDNEQ